MTSFSNKFIIAPYNETGMKILLCSNAFKGTLSALEANEAIRNGLAFLSDAIFESLPLADGGDGTLECLLETGDYEKVVGLYTGIDIHKKEESYYLVDKEGRAYIAIYPTSGLGKTMERIPEERSTLGFGEQIKDALDRGTRDFVLFLGGSSTIDLGCGMLIALGARFKDGEGQAFLPSGLTMERVEAIDLSGLDPRLASCRFVLCHDVFSPLSGRKGAVFLFSGQKGTKKEDMPRLEKAVTRLAAMEESLLKRKARDIPGAGAAGGVGFAALLFLSATPVSGAERILKALRLEERLTKDSLLVTGEGKIDTSSLEGKSLFFLSRLCKRKGVPFLTVSGSIDRRCKERLRRLGGRLFVVSGKPAGNKADNQDKIIGALEKEKERILSLTQEVMRHG